MAQPTYPKLTSQQKDRILSNLAEIAKAGELKPVSEEPQKGSK